MPPITVPAWSCMMSSRTPGDLGIYGFRNRADHSYDGLFIANGAAVKEPRLWDIVGRRGQAQHRARRAGHVPRQAAQRRHGLVLPDALDRVAVHVPAGPAQRGRGRRRRVPLRLHRVPHGGQGRSPAPDLRDDRQALQARRPPAEHEAVGALRDGRDGHRPHPPRLLEGHGPGAPQARAGRRLRAGDPRLPRPRRRAAGEPAAPRRRRDGRAGRLRPRRQAHGRAASASTSGCARRACSGSSASPRAAPARATAASTGRARRSGPRAATTPACSSTSRAASPRGRSRRPTTSASATS